MKYRDIPNNRVKGIRYVYIPDFESKLFSHREESLTMPMVIYNGIFWKVSVLLIMCIHSFSMRVCL